jgi:hypothetical protein
MKEDNPYRLQKMSDVPDGSHVEIGRPDVHRAMGKPKLGIV